MKEVTYEGMTFEPYITAETIKNRIAEIGRDIVRDCGNTKPLFICVLNGAFPFASDLFREVEDIDAEITFVRLKSYDGMGSTGKVKEMMGLKENIEGRNVIVVEDIVDTGRTIAGLLETLRERNPAALKVATLLYLSLIHI